MGREGEALLTAFHRDEGSGLESPGEREAESLLEVVRRAGGGEYRVGLRRYAGRQREALLRFKRETDPEGILGA